MHLRLVIALSIPAVSFAQSTPTRSAKVRQFVSIDTSLLALTHARVSDGTGAPARPDQTLVIERGVIRAVGDRERRSVFAHRGYREAGDNVQGRHRL